MDKLIHELITLVRATGAAAKDVAEVLKALQSVLRELRWLLSLIAVLFSYLYYFVV